MSYYGLRKVRVYKSEETDKWTFSCDCYDSSIRDYRGNRVWEHVDSWWKDENHRDTKEDVEYYLFENTLDGNFHGTGGKYTCIEWGKNTVTLPKEQQDELTRLDNLRWNSPERVELRELRYTKYKDTTSEEWYNLQEVKKVEEMEKSYTKVYYELRYKYWYKAWQDYLQEKKQTGRVIIRVSSPYGDLYVKSLGTRTLKYSSYRDGAKVFKEPKSALLKKLDGFPVSNIRFIDADIKSEEVLV